MTNIGVHRSHCCAAHGCKYSSTGCPVSRLEVIQDSPCEMCAPIDDGERVQFAVQVFDQVSGEWFVPRGEWYGEVMSCVLAYRRVLEHARPGQRLRMAERRVLPERGFADSGVLTSKES